jgi:multisubunit Na+/H+ antiporter MnhB subunit
VEINTGVIVTGVAMLFFYFRLAMLRGRKRRLDRQEALEVRRSPKKKKVLANGKNDFAHPRYEVRNWAMVVVALVLMLTGVAMYTAKWVPQDYQQYWWISATAGVLLFSFCFK